MNVELKSMPFDSNEVYDPATGATSYDRVAYSKDLADWLATYFSNGIVVKGSNILTTELQVTHTGGLNLSVNRGVVVINGRTGWAQEPTVLTVDMGGANPRIDRVVMELNIANRFIYLKVLKGTENANPVAPELSQTDDLYHIPLAQVRVEAASAVVGTVTDERAGYLSNVTVGIKPPTGNDAVTVAVSETTRQLYELSTQNANVDNALQGVMGKVLGIHLTNFATGRVTATAGVNNEVTLPFVPDVVFINALQSTSGYVVSFAMLPNDNVNRTISSAGNSYQTDVKVSSNIMTIYPYRYARTDFFYMAIKF